MAVLSKAGCNLGTCHGNQNGKGGFRLSLRGENPEADFVTLTHDQSGRRANAVDADQSLMLLKATMQVPHEGGKRFDDESPEYRVLRRWIVAGLPRSPDDEVSVTRLVVSPSEQVLIEPSDSISLRVLAVMADDSTRDVTRLACFDASQPIVSISVDGLVKRERFGEVTVAVRYLNQQVPVRLAFIPMRQDFTWKATKSANFIDENVFAKLQSLRMNPSEVCDDTTFLRRASLDLIGVYDFQRMNQVIVTYHAVAHGEVKLSPELLEYKLMEPANIRCWRAGTGFALADWLRSQGLEPVFMEDFQRPADPVV